MKKKFMSILVSIVVALSLVNVGYASSGITVKLDGNPLTFDVQPQLIGGRTMVPLRVIFESLGAMVEWDDSTKTVTAYNEFYVVNATIGSNTMIVNGEQRQIDVPPMIVDSRTLVPARFVAEAFNCNVEWDGNSKTVYITSGKNDYSQVEKDTGNANTQGTTVSTNNPGYDKLKNFLIEHGVKKYAENGSTTYTYIIDIPVSNTYIVIIYNQPSEYIGIVSYHDDPKAQASTEAVLMIYPNKVPTISYTIKLLSGREYKFFGTFSNENKPFSIITYTGPSGTQVSGYKVANADLGMIDILIEHQLGITLDGLGIYYTKIE